MLRNNILIKKIPTKVKKSYIISLKTFLTIAKNKGKGKIQYNSFFL